MEHPLVALGGAAGDDGTHRFVFRRRRPLHRGRFLAFAERHFGPLQLLPARSSSAAAAGGLCKRRRPLVDAAAGASNEAEPRPLLDEEAVSAVWAVHAASGCIWFAGSDDKQVDWKFEASGPGKPGTHELRRGVPWPVAAVDEGAEAGERRVELAFTLRRARPPGEEDFEEPAWMSSPLTAEERAGVEAAERRLREALLACLLTRSEATALEAGDLRVLDVAGCDGSVAADAATLQWSPALTFLEALVDVVSAAPGHARLAAFGSRLARGTARVLGGVPEGPGHDGS